MDQFFTWETLGTVAGATAIITIILAIVDRIVGTMNIRIRNAIVTLVSVGLMVAGAVSAGTASTWETYVLSVLNGLVVALAVLRLEDTSLPRLISRSKGEEVSYPEA